MENYKEYKNETTTVTKVQKTKVTSECFKFHVYVCTGIIVGYGASLMTLPLRMYKSTCGYFGSWIRLRYGVCIYFCGNLYK